MRSRRQPIYGSVTSPAVAGDSLGELARPAYGSQQSKGLFAGGQEDLEGMAQYRRLLSRQQNIEIGTAATRNTGGAQ
ncbi:hypothetical protein O1611_g6701 [Lasiodiplodia mahajangana]|uniref:Uncharacterized protein n=1 Tax=Lasiodiplodia mahajangana TaxID=1108764 RepID=A0ACC2JIC6_9PEZI|nr:hypothetical protein O1611_g6701 [Lasiodiplodia mahajangana]